MFFPRPPILGNSTARMCPPRTSLTTESREHPSGPAASFSEYIFSKVSIFKNLKVKYPRPFGRMRSRTEPNLKHPPPTRCAEDDESKKKNSAWLTPSLMGRGLVHYRTKSLRNSYSYPCAGAETDLELLNS